MAIGHEAAVWRRKVGTGVTGHSARHHVSPHLNYELRGHEIRAPRAVPRFASKGRGVKTRGDAASGNVAFSGRWIPPEPSNGHVRLADHADRSRESLVKIDPELPTRPP